MDGWTDVRQTQLLCTQFSIVDSGQWTMHTLHWHIEMNDIITNLNKEQKAKSAFNLHINYHSLALNDQWPNVLNTLHWWWVTDKHTKRKNCDGVKEKMQSKWARLAVFLINLIASFMLLQSSFACLFSFSDFVSCSKKYFVLYSVWAPTRYFSAHFDSFRFDYAIWTMFDIHHSQWNQMVSKWQPAPAHQFALNERSEKTKKEERKFKKKCSNWVTLATIQY